MRCALPAAAPSQPRCSRAARLRAQPLPRAAAGRCRPASSARGLRPVCSAAQQPPESPESVDETTRKWGLEAGLWKARFAEMRSGCVCAARVRAQCAAARALVTQRLSRRRGTTKGVHAEGRRRGRRHGQQPEVHAGERPAEGMPLPLPLRGRCAAGTRTWQTLADAASLGRGTRRCMAAPTSSPPSRSRSSPSRSLMCSCPRAWTSRACWKRHAAWPRVAPPAAGPGADAPRRARRLASPSTPPASRWALSRSLMRCTRRRRPSAFRPQSRSRRYDPAAPSANRHAQRSRQPGFSDCGAVDGQGDQGLSLLK